MYRAESRSQVYATASRVEDRVTELRLGGAMLTLAGAIILLGIVSAEALYPTPYTTGGNQISDLGGTEPPAALVYQPSAAIFDGSMIATGLLVIGGALLLGRAFGRRAVTIPILVLGIGALGVGLFPGNTGTPHALFAMATFVSGGVAAITSALVSRGPFRYLSILLGATALLTLAGYMVMGDGSPLAGLGIGGVERWVVYPIVIWTVAFGGYAAGRAEA